MNTIKVMVIDDSAIVRRVLTDMLAGHGDIEVVGTAPDPIVARQRIKELNPDILTLDIEMPRMDGVTFLKELMREHPMPVVVISSLGERGSRIAMEALEAGAVEVIPKPGGPYSVSDLKGALVHKVRAAAAAKGRLRVRTPISAGPAAPPAPVIKPAVTANHTFGGVLLAIGASTGGTEAIFEVLSHLPPDRLPGIVITQHIGPNFSRAFAQRLDKQTAFSVKEAAGGEQILPGTVWVAPGDLHLSVIRAGATYQTVVKTGPQVCFQRPAVDVLFGSVADAAAAKAVAVLLTGMGSDGAQGMKRIRDKGGFNIAQDEASCVVYGMPREAFKLGVVDKVASLKEIPESIMAAIEAKVRRAA